MAAYYLAIPRAYDVVDVHKFVLEWHLLYIAPVIRSFFNKVPCTICCWHSARLMLDLC